MPHKQKKPKSRKSLLLRLVMVLLAGYAVVILVDMQVSLSERRQQLQEMEERLEEQRVANKELERQLADGVDEEFIERFAREQLDYVAPDERVFIDRSGM